MPTVEEINEFLGRFQEEEGVETVVLTVILKNKYVMHSQGMMNRLDSYKLAAEALLIAIKEELQLDS